MKTQQDILHGRSLEDVAEAARAYEETHAPFDKRPMKMRARPPRHMMAKPDIALYMEKIRMCLHIWLHLSLQQQLSLTYSAALPDVRERLSKWEEVLEIQSDGFSNLMRGTESFLS